MPLSREAILGASDLPTEEVEVPEWGGTVLVRSMNGTERDAWEQSLIVKGRGDGVDVTNIRARLVAICAVDAAGKRLFSDTDATALGKKSAAALDRVAKVAQRLNGLTAAEVEDARGN